MITKEYAEFFIENQEQLFDFPVADTLEEAMEFLEEAMAEVFDNIDELKEYLDQCGMDIVGMSDEEIIDSSEIFKLPDGKLMYVEG